MGTATCLVRLASDCGDCDKAVETNYLLSVPILVAGRRCLCAWLAVRRVDG